MSLVPSRRASPRPSRSGDPLGGRTGARGQAVDADFGAGDEVAVADDEPRPGDADADDAAIGPGRQVAEVSGVGGGHARVHSRAADRAASASMVSARAGVSRGGGGSMRSAENQRANSASAAPRATERAARPKPSSGASTAMSRTPPRQSAGQDEGKTRASAARTVKPSSTTCGSHILYAGQVSAARPRLGQGAGGLGRPPPPQATRYVPASRFSRWKNAL